MMELTWFVFLYGEPAAARTAEGVDNLESHGSHHGADSVARWIDGRSSSAAPGHRSAVRTQELPASEKPPASPVFLKNEMCDPAHSWISAIVGLVMRTALGGGWPAHP